MATIPTGRFVWFDYVGNDHPKAQGFYGELFGWRTQAHGGDYAMIAAGDHMIGGYMHSPKGAPPQAHWLSYLQVEDCAATVAKIRGLGGKVRLDTNKMENAGTMAIVGDPTEATFGLWQPTKAEGTGDFHGKDGTWCWVELMTSDAERCAEFYKAIGGFEHDRVEMGPMTYHLLKRDGVPRAGLFKTDKPNVPVAWVPYVQVESCDRTTERAKQLGATVHHAPTDIPNVGRFAVFADSTGAAIGILQPPKR
jgi:predicted enzyme related to lactoylglutathione lyase